MSQKPNSTQETTCKSDCLQLKQKMETHTLKVKHSSISGKHVRDTNDNLLLLYIIKVPYQPRPPNPDSLAWAKVRDRLVNHGTKRSSILLVLQRGQTKRRFARFACSVFPRLERQTQGSWAREDAGLHTGVASLRRESLRQSPNCAQCRAKPFLPIPAERFLEPARAHAPPAAAVLAPRAGRRKSLISSTRESVRDAGQGTVLSKQATGQHGGRPSLTRTVCTCGRCLAVQASSLRVSCRDSP